MLSPHSKQVEKKNITEQMYTVEIPDIFDTEKISKKIM